MFRSLAFIGVLICARSSSSSATSLAASCRKRTRASSWSTRVLPDAASLERTDARHEEGGGGARKRTKRSRASTRSAGFSLLTARLLLEHGLLLRAARSRGSDRARDATAATRDRSAERGVRASRFAKAPSSPSARRPFRASARGAGFTMELQDRQRRLAGLPGASRRRSSSRPRASGRRSAASTRSIAPAVPQIFADIDRSKVLKSGVQLGRRQHDARRAARQLIRERLQQVRPRLQGSTSRPSRNSDAMPKPARPVLRAEPGGRHGAARHACDDAPERRS